MTASRPAVRLAIAGLLLLAAQAYLLFLSRDFAPEVVLAARPIPVLTIIGLASGLLYLLLLPILTALTPTRSLLALVLLLGLAMRLLAMAGTPILEDDFNRYLWDGGVVAAGLNPYAASPAEAPAQPGFEELTATAGPLLQKVNHPDLRSLYPPGAQAAFALAHWIEPWGLDAWRLVLLGFDLAVVALILLLLRELGASPLWAALYWWNPLLIQQVFNAGHMDVLPLPFMLAALLFAVRGRGLATGGALGLAAAMKLWPVLLLPLVLRSLWHRSVAAAWAAGLGGGIFLVSLWPILAAGMDRDSGLLAFSTGWAANDALFLGLTWLFDEGLQALGVIAVNGDAAARMLVWCLVAAAALWVARDVPRDLSDLCGRALFVVAALFLLSPAQFPWYAVWLLPLLALRPVPALLLLTPLLALYPLRFYFLAQDNLAAFDQGLVWLIWLPVWAALAWQFRPRAPASTRQAPA